MSDEDTPLRDRPYDIRERLFVFACDVVLAAQKMHSRSSVAAALCPNLVTAATSAASNAEEADDASSTRDFVAKERIALRELKESRLRLRVMQRAGYLDREDYRLIEEALELTRIIATIIRNRERATDTHSSRP